MEGGGGGGDIPDMRQMRSFCVSPICLPYYVPASSPVRVRPAIRVQTSAPLESHSLGRKLSTNLLFENI